MRFFKSAKKRRDREKPSQQELKFARQDVREARRLSLWAIWISAFALITPRCCFYFLYLGCED